MSQNPENFKNFNPENLFNPKCVSFAKQCQATE